MSVTALRIYPRPVEADEEPVSGIALTLSGVGRSFDTKNVLSALDLHVPAGQFVAIVGRSGCGKSTLLRLLADLDQPSEGRIELAASGSAGAPARIMFQEPRLLPWQSVVQNVEVGLPVGLDRHDRREKALGFLDEVGLEDRAGDWPSVLSGGQKQRVALARALASRPGLLLLDEPLGALDALTRIEMQALLERVWREQRFTAVLVTHDVTEALALADRVILLDGGRITLDMEVPLPRPRRRGTAELARLEGRVLEHLFEANTARDEVAHG
ncbi:ATP-binding cassette domain-containing protein [Terrihabitans rhizophilus]|uniref:ATP-binding cassette domain-containing protein n=1 Tax=Terrihabitans rhizophilus TaxID=3092662 RepID=A0ABU4RJR0_9HYPH|nr:ATP-binding cassette domain-containing protein [Terrihabitans sp. PJ23]MDX6804438.1 ATP-binding cassette domain-containing protein [Terrihabitans sp. PJ23]